MPSRIVMPTANKRPPWKKKAAAITVPAIVTQAYRPKRAPRKRKAQATAITGPAIVKAPSKRDRIRRREEADEGREVSPEEEAAAEAFIARMMRPR